MPGKPGIASQQKESRAAGPDDCNHPAGYLYIALKDIMEGIVLLMILWAIYRRAVLKPKRLHNTFEAYLVLAMIGILMVSDLLLDGARYNLIQLFNNPQNIHYFNNPLYGSEFVWTPVSVGAAGLISGLGAEANASILAVMLWLHIFMQLAFLNILPLGKHFHVITALPNVFLKSLGYPHEKAKLLDLEDADAWEEESLGINHIHQLNWAQGLDIKTMADDPDADYLLWVGCAGSFDDRSKKVSISLARILQKAGVRFAILGVEEKCTGDFARKVGNEMLYQTMARENIETLNGYNVKKIIAACPHCLNTLKHDYPQLGGNYEVIHHGAFIDQLVKDGKIKLKQSQAGALTYHDPCYLGRYNNIYDEPRSILRSISGGGFKELGRHGRESFCCGAGGGRMWMEEKIGKRINLERSEEIVNLQVSSVAVGCPFCLTMIEDGMKELGKEEEIKTMDIAELVEKNML